MKNESMIQKLFQGKRVTKMGFGPNGRSYGDILFLVRNGAHVLVTDYRDEPDIQASKEKLLLELTEDQQLQLTFVLGEHREKDFIDTDMVIKASGVSLDSQYIQASEKAGIPVISTSAFLYKIAHESFENIITIGVTGTKGKSTTTDMIEHVLKQLGVSYHVAGNIRGVANLPVLEELQDGDVILGELDSWQLQGFGDLKISPKVSVFTNFFEDHLNYYKGSMQAYFDDKAEIYLHQSENDMTFISTQAEEAISQYGKPQETLYTVDTSALQGSELQVLGEQNRENAALAFAASRSLGLDEKDVLHALSMYKPMEGRLRIMGEKRGITYVDDNNSTTPTSSIQTIKALQKAYLDANIHVLGGGADKEFDYFEFGTYLDNHVSSMALFAGAATDKIINHVSSLNYKVVDSMKAAWDFAHGHATKGDIIVLTPGAASFGVFLNEYERGDRFRELFDKL